MLNILFKRKAEVLGEYFIKALKVSIGRAKGNNIVLPLPDVPDMLFSLVYSNHRFIINVEAGEDERFAQLDEVGITEDTYVSIDEEYSLVFRPEKADDIQSMPKTGKKAAVKVSASGTYTGDKAVQDPAYLLAISGPNCGKKYELSLNETKIGRDYEYNDVVLEFDKSVSRDHAKIMFIAGNYVVVDRRSRNRTYFNSKKLKEDETVILKNADEIKIGKTIFRFVTKNVVKTGRPAKALVLIEKVWEQFVNIVLAVLFVGGVYISVTAFLPYIKTFSGIKDANVEFVVSNTVAQLRESVSTGKYTQMYTLDNGIGVYCLPPSVACVDLKSSDAVILLETGGMLKMYDCKKKNVSWEYDTLTGGAVVMSAPATGDFNGDGIDDVVVVSNKSRISVLDGKTGIAIYTSQGFGGNLLDTSLAIADFDNNMEPDIAACNTAGGVILVYNLTSNAEVVTYNLNEPVCVNPVVYTSSEGKTEIVVVTYKGTIAVIDGVTKKETVIALNTLVNSRLGLTHNDALGITAMPVVGDFNGNKSMDIVVLTKHNYLYGYDIKAGHALWDKLVNIEPAGLVSSKISCPSLTAGDANSDGYTDFWAITSKGYVVLVDGLSGKVVWNENLRNKTVCSSAILHDFNNDGVYEIVFGVLEDGLMVLDGNAVSKNRILSTIKIPCKDFIGTPVIDDVEGDGMVEIAFNIDNKMLIIETTLKKRGDGVHWNQYRCNNHRNGVLEKKVEKEGNRGIFSVAGIVMILAAIGLLLFKLMPPRLKTKHLVIN